MNFKMLAAMLGMDSQVGVFFEQQLELIKARLLDMEFPELKFLKYVPVSMEAPEGAETITQRMWTALGLARIIASNAHDLPRVNLKASKVTVPVRDLGDSFAYTIHDLAAAAMAGIPLESKEAAGARLAIEMLHDDLAMIGDADHGLYGLLTHPNFSKFEAPNGDWASDDDADDLLEDLEELINYPRVISNGVRNANTMLLPLDKMTVIKYKRISTVNETTVLKFFQSLHPEVVIDDVAKLSAVPLNPRTGAVEATKVAVAFERNPDVLTYEMPKDFTQLPPQPKGLEFEVPCYSRSGGVMSSHPLGVAVMDGV